MTMTDWNKENDRLAESLGKTLREIFALEKGLEDAALEAQSNPAAKKRYDKMQRQLEALREKAHELELAEEAANRKAEAQMEAQEHKALAEAKKKAAAAAKEVLANAREIDGTLTTLNGLIDEHQRLIRQYLTEADHAGEPNLAVRRLLGAQERTIGYAARANAPQLFSILRPFIPSAVDHAAPLHETYGRLL